MTIRRRFGLLRARLVLVLAAVGWLAAAAHAQTSEPAPAAGAEESRAASIEDELRRETERQHQLFGIARARVSYPQLASVGLGMLIGEHSRAYDCKIQCEVTGWLASAEAGVGGAVFNLGPAYLIAELGDNKYFLSRRYMGYSVRGSLLRTWGDTPRGPARAWHAGVEGEFTVVSLNLTLGFYRRIGDGDAGRPWLVSGGIGWGF